MERKYILVSLIIAVFAIFALLSLASGLGLITNAANYDVDIAELTNELTIDNSNWSYDEKNNIYYQLGVVYCSNPQATEYESLAIYVPGDYFNAIENPNGTYTCSVINANVGNYSASDAPIVMPINTPGYSAHPAPSSYDPKDVINFTNAGLIYVDAGCRGKENGGNYSGGAPWGVTDLKAAVLYLRFNGETLPGDSERIFSFGHSGGGAQSAILGASGDSDLYIPYLESIGAAIVDRNGNKLSDSIYGSMCWCPITSLDTADEAYEWAMGQYSSSGTRGNGTWTGELSDDLAIEYANYINNLKLKSNRHDLTLEESNDGIYTSGSYYDYMLSLVETSLNNFLKDTTFPYTPSSSKSMAVGSASGDDMAMGSAFGEIPGDDTAGDFGISSTGSLTYQTPQDYIDSLNSDGEWVIYNSSSNTVKITSIGAFVNHCKNPSKDTGAFDDLGRGQAENDLFGNNESEKLHFDSIMANVLKENGAKYYSYYDYDSSKAEQYESDLAKLDELNNTVQNRLNMYNPMYYLCDYYDGSGTSNPAKYWRINSGIEQEDTSFTVEANLALALEQCDAVNDVDFTTVWGQGHTEAERKGSPNANFINWVNECMQDDSDFLSFLF